MAWTKQPNRSKTLRKALAVKRAGKDRAGQVKCAGGVASQVASSQLLTSPVQFGATILPHGQVRFILWAPREPRVMLELCDSAVHAMHVRPGGFHELILDCQPGTRYRYRFPDGRTMPDPASRCQDGGVHGFSCVVDPAGYSWNTEDWRGLLWTQTVIYEVHAGLAGGFDGVRRKLPGLAQLGITAIELMPVAAFPGERNWGYDGVLPYAPHETYGTPDQLRQLIDAAHGLGVQVFLDVVYNHFGPHGNYFHHCFPDFFRHDIQTPWGDAIDFRQPEVRSFFTENALYWLREYRFDGLRLDAVHAISEQDWLIEMATAVHKKYSHLRHVHLVVENDNNDTHLLQNGFRAQWNDDAHHVVHHILTGESDGYYAAYSEHVTQNLLRVLSDGFISSRDDTNGMSSAYLPVSAFVFFLQNHDQTGNRAWGERLATLCESCPELLRAAIALQLLAPHIPLVFMGEERGSRRPFLYFTDFDDPDLVEAIREGRRREFQRFSSYSDRPVRALPEPNDFQTWQYSDPYAEPIRESVYQYYSELLRIRRQFISPYLNRAQVEEAQVVGDRAVMVRWRLDNDALLSMYCNLSQTDLVLVQDTVRMNERCIHASRDMADAALHAGRLISAATVVTLVAPSSLSLQRHQPSKRVL